VNFGKGKGAMKMQILMKLVGKFDETLVILYVSRGQYYVREKGFDPIYLGKDERSAREAFRINATGFM
jgi:hypothetical protein